MSDLFLGTWIMIQSAGQTNRLNHEALLRWFVCSALRFIPHESRKKHLFLLFALLPTNILPEIFRETLKIQNSYSNGLFHFSLFWHFWASILNFCNSFVWPRITDEGSVPEMRIWSILFIKSDLKWCIHLSRSLFLHIHIILLLITARAICQTVELIVDSSYRELNFSRVQRRKSDTIANIIIWAVADLDFAATVMEGYKYM